MTRIQVKADIPIEKPTYPLPVIYTVRLRNQYSTNAERARYRYIDKSTGGEHAHFVYQRDHS